MRIENWLIWYREVHADSPARRPSLFSFCLRDGASGRLCEVRPWKIGPREEARRSMFSYEFVLAWFGRMTCLQGQPAADINPELEEAMLATEMASFHHAVMPHTPYSRSSMRTYAAPGVKSMSSSFQFFGGHGLVASFFSLPTGTERLAFRCVRSTNSVGTSELSISMWT